MGVLDKDATGGGAETLPPITEPVIVQDTFATGCEVDYYREFVRLTYWAEHPLGFGENALRALERQVVCKIVLPAADLERAVSRFMMNRAIRRQKIGCC